jgi:hypothetical protein
LLGQFGKLVAAGFVGRVFRVDGPDGYLFNVLVYQAVPIVAGPDGEWDADVADGEPE